MTVFSNTAAVSDTIAISGLSSLGAGSYSAPSSLIDNTPSGPRGVSYLRGLVRLSFSSPLTAGAASAGGPALTLFRLIAADGTNLPSPPGASATAPLPTALQSPVPLIATAAFQIVDFGPFDIDAFLYGFQLYNNSGVAFSGTATLTFERWNVQGA